MEYWQALHIDQNLPTLIETTRSTTMFKSFLKRQGVVTTEEEEMLTALGDNYGNHREAKVMYGILKTRRNAYEALLYALKETKQTGALNLLKQGQQNQVSLKMKTVAEQLMEIEVELLGTVQSFRQCFSCLENETVLELLNCEEVQRELAEVIQSHGILKLTPDLPELHKLYIPRAISNRLLLDPDIFKKNCSDIFVFKGVDRCDLVEVVSPHVIRMSSTQLSVITCRHIHLDDDEDWDDLVLKAKAPLHLVYKDEDGYILQRSTQVTNILHEHWLDKTRNRDAYLLEEKFISQFIDEKNKKGALVCDVPGMGKTWLMQSIATRIQILSSKTVVFFIQLDTFAKYLAKQNQFSEDADTLCRVLRFLYDTKLGVRILSLFAEKNDMNLVFVFDGFDEVSHVHIKNLTLFLKNLSAIKYTRFIISSRPNMRAHLEETFNLISFDILPFGKQEQVASIVHRWQETILEGDGKKLTEFAEQCIDSFKVIRLKDRRDILGVPLQCYLLAVVNEASARQFCKPNRRKDFVVHGVAKMESMCELYTQFFNRLALKGFMEPTDAEKCNIQTVERFHTHKALELLFPEIAPVFLKSFEYEIEDFPTKLGVLCHGRNSKLEFIHRSLAEFLTGKFFAEFWMNIKSHDPTLVESVGSYFIINVIKPLGEKQYRKNFLNYEDMIYDYRIDNLRITKNLASFSCSTVLWFMNSLYRMKSEENGTISFFADTLGSQQRLHPVWRRLAASIQIQKDIFTLCKENIRKYSYINIIGCVNHNFSSLLCLLVSLMKVFFKDTERLALLKVPSLFKNKSPHLPFLLCYIAAFGCPENASDVFELFDGSSQNFFLKFCMNYPKEFYTPLEVGVLQKNLDMVLFFYHKVKKNDERLLQAFIYGITCPKANMNVNITILETVFGSVSKFFSYLSVLTFQLVDRYESLLNLINLAWTCKCSLPHASVKNKRSFFKIILEHGTDKDFIKLLLLLFPSENNDRFYFPYGLIMDSSGDISEYAGEAVLQNLNLDGIKMALPKNLEYIWRRIANVEKLKMLIRIAPNLAIWDTKIVHNILYVAVNQGNVFWVEYLIKSGCDINERYEFGKTPLHYVDLDRRGAKMAKILVNNGADVYAVSYDKQNFAHYVCSQMKSSWSEHDLERVTKWVKYLIEAGYGEIWKMRDCDGNTPLDLVFKVLGRGHLVTEELLTLLQAEGIISSL